MNITHGLYIQLVNRSNSRIVFSAATDQLTEDAFTKLWTAVGQSIYTGMKATDLASANYYELRIDPIVGDHPAKQR